MKTKPLTFLLVLTFLFLFSGSSTVVADELQDGWSAYERKDYKTAHRLILPLTEQGVTDAQTNKEIENLDPFYQPARGTLEVQ